MNKRNAGLARAIALITLAWICGGAAAALPLDGDKGVDLSNAAGERVEIGRVRFEPLGVSAGASAST